MKKTRRTTEQIIRILREAEASSRKTEEVCRTNNISAQTYYRWKSKYGGMDLKEARRLRALEKENTEFKKLLADQLLKTKALEIALEKHLSPARQRKVATLVRSRLSCSGRSVCRWFGFNRSTMWYRPKPLPPRKRLLEAQIVKVSREHPTRGYKKVSALMGSKGYLVNKKQVQRVRREEGLQVPPPKRRERLSTSLPQQATHRNHVWCWDFGCGLYPERREASSIQSDRRVYPRVPLHPRRPLDQGNRRAAAAP